MLMAVQKLPNWLKSIILTIAPASNTAFFINIFFVRYIVEIPCSNNALHSTAENMIGTLSEGKYGA